MRAPDRPDSRVDDEDQHVAETHQLTGRRRGEAAVDEELAGKLDLLDPAELAQLDDRDPAAGCGDAATGDNFDHHLIG